MAQVVHQNICLMSSASTFGRIGMQGGVGKQTGVPHSHLERCVVLVLLGGAQRAVIAAVSLPSSNAHLRKQAFYGKGKGKGEL